MDRRSQKTRDAILSAFCDLLKQKKYSNITVQEIIDAANVGRSTFYSHFETKDELLHELCRDMFEHVFTGDLACEFSRGFSGEIDLEARVTHILYHIKDSRRDIKSILSCEVADLFWNDFKAYLVRLFDEVVKKENDNTVPKDFILNHYICSFIEAIKWWMKNNMEQTPEVLARYYMKTINK